jgi:integrase
MGKRSFGQITRLPSKRFRARYTGPDSVLHNAPSTFETRVDAEAWLTDERRMISAGTWSSPVARKAARTKAEAERLGRMFGTYVETWLAGQHDLRPTTRKSYRTSLDLHLKPTFATVPIHEITVEMVDAWFAAYGDKTPTARAHAYQVLTAVMKHAEAREHIARNPCRVKAGSKARVKRQPEALTLVELLSLADAMPAKHRALTLLSGFCGLRFGEAVALRRRDVDLTNGVVRIERGAVQLKGEKSTNRPKTDAGIRSVHMPDIVVDALREHMAESITGGRDALIFPGADGEILSNSALYGLKARTERRGRKVYKKAAYGFYGAREAIGKPNLHWHDLRRTAATLGAQSGATVKEMQSRLGHATPAMALHYQQATAERDRAIADRLQAEVDALGRIASVTPISST